MRAPCLLAFAAFVGFAFLPAPAVPSFSPPVGDGHAEVSVDADGRRWVCEDGVCRILDEDAEEAGESAPRILVGSRGVDEFLAFLGDGDSGEGPRDGGAFSSFTWLTLLLAVLGGLALNLTPCVLPMIPVNLIVIGKSPLRGAAYGLGMAVAYGTLGVLASVGLLAFGTIQSSPWFNAFVAAVFVALALSMLGVFSIDLSRYRPASAAQGASRASLAVPFFLGSLSAVLAGACVAPMLLSVIVLTARLFSEGSYSVLALPFALGLGMALPWPFLGAGMKVLPRPGAWMSAVNRVFGVVILLFAMWYAHLALCGWSAQGAGGSAPRRADGAVECTPATFESAMREAAESGKPVFVDCWATWCKNCAAMERTTLADERVKAALSRYAVIRLDATDVGAFRELKPFAGVQGLPAYAVFAVGKRRDDAL